MYILENSEIFNWCSQGGVLTVFRIIKTVLNLVRYIVPIALVFITTIDVFKNVINPNEKEGLKVVVNRVIAAVVIFFIPTLVNIIMKLVNVGLNSNDKYGYNVTDCWINSK